MTSVAGGDKSSVDNAKMTLTKRQGLNMHSHGLKYAFPNWQITLEK